MANEVNYLYEPSGSELHWDGIKPVSAAQASVPDASLAGPSMVHPADRNGMQGTQAAQASSYAAPPPAPEPATRRPTYDELRAAAEQMMAGHMAEHAASLAAGPSVGARNDAGGKIPSWLENEMKKDGR